MCVCSLLIVVLATPESSRPAAPVICTDSVVRGLVRDFTRVFNRGEWDRVDRLWSRQDFRWFTAFQAEPRVLHQVFERADLIPFFKNRHLRGERFHLLTFRLNSSHGYANFEYFLSRRADDLAEGSTGFYGGKGAAGCYLTRPQLVLWSMGRRA